MSPRSSQIRTVHSPLYTRHIRRSTSVFSAQVAAPISSDTRTKRRATISTMPARRCATISTTLSQTLRAYIDRPISATTPSHPIKKLRVPLPSQLLFTFATPEYSNTRVLHYNIITANSSNTGDAQLLRYHKYTRLLGEFLFFGSRYIFSGSVKLFSSAQWI
jgi:hypothetical protein